MRVMLSLGVVLALSSSTAAQDFDLLLKGGHVIDGRNKISAVRDVGIKDGKITEVASDIPAARALKTVDVSGLYVTPGLIDIHGHVYRPTVGQELRADSNAVYPDGFSFRSGVTTFVDPGGAGWRNFEDMKNRVIDRSLTRVLAFINIVGRGSAGGKYEQDLTDMDVEGDLRHGAQAQGTHHRGQERPLLGPEWDPFTRAVEAGTIAEFPVMIDFGSRRPERPLHDLLTRIFRPGDIYTHVYGGLRGEQDAATLGPSDAVVAGPETRHHLRRRPWRRQLPLAGRRTDDQSGLPAGHHLHRSPRAQHEHDGEGHAQSDEQVSRDGRAARSGGRLRTPGMRPRPSNRSSSDIFQSARWPTWRCLRVEKGAFGFSDMHGARLKGDQRLRCELTLRDGKVVYDLNDVTGTDWDKLPAGYTNQGDPRWDGYAQPATGGRGRGR